MEDQWEIIESELVCEFKMELENLSYLYRSVIEKLKSLKNAIDDHEGKKFDMKLFGATLASVGTIVGVTGCVGGFLLAPITFGTSIAGCITLAGTGTALLGGLYTSFAEVGNIVLINSFLKDLNQLDRSQRKAVEKFQKKLNLFHHLVENTMKYFYIPFPWAFTFLLKLVKTRDVLLEDIDVDFKIVIQKFPTTLVSPCNASKCKIIICLPTDLFVDSSI